MQETETTLSFYFRLLGAKDRPKNKKKRKQISKAVAAYTW